MPELARDKGRRLAVSVMRGARSTLGALDVRLAARARGVRALARGACGVTFV